jgi:hypothetical protein
LVVSSRHSATSTYIKLYRAGSLELVLEYGTISLRKPYFPSFPPLRTYSGGQYRKKVSDRGGKAPEIRWIVRRRREGNLIPGRESFFFPHFRRHFLVDWVADAVWEEGFETGLTDDRQIYFQQSFICVASLKCSLSFTSLHRNERPYSEIARRLLVILLRKGKSRNGWLLLGCRFEGGISAATSLFLSLSATHRCPEKPLNFGHELERAKSGRQTEPSYVHDVCTARVSGRQKLEQFLWFHFLTCHKWQRSGILRRKMHGEPWHKSADDNFAQVCHLSTTTSATNDSMVIRKSCKIFTAKSRRRRKVILHIGNLYAAAAEYKG